MFIWIEVCSAIALLAALDWKDEAQEWSCSAGCLSSGPHWFCGVHRAILHARRFQFAWTRRLYSIIFCCKYTWVLLLSNRSFEIKHGFVDFYIVFWSKQVRNRERESEGERKEFGSRAVWPHSRPFWNAFDFYTLLFDKYFLIFKCNKEKIIDNNCQLYSAAFVFLLHIRIFDLNKWVRWLIVTLERYFSIFLLFCGFIFVLGINETKQNRNQVNLAEILELRNCVICCTCLGQLFCLSEHI